MPFEPIVAQNVSIAAARQIRDLIAQDVLKPGDQLPGERDLAQRLDISRTTLRSALQTLVTEGLLVARQGSGLFVAERIGGSILDPILKLIEAGGDAVIDYLRFRAMIEGECAATAATRATADEIGHIAEIHNRLCTAHLDGDRALASRFDTEFHLAIVTGSGNRVAIQVARSLHTLLQNSIRRHNDLTYEEPGLGDMIVEQHARILSAIQDGDASGAQAAMRAHLDHFVTLIERQSDIAARQQLVARRAGWDAETKRNT